jgi:hypothetical protein
MLKIGKGQRVSTIMRFRNEEVVVDLRRINNKNGHLQFRYERKVHQRLRDYLSALTDKSKYKAECVIEIVEASRGIFEIHPIAGFDDNKPKLAVYNPVCHLFNECELSSSIEFREIVEVISNIDFVPDHTQREYNLSIYKGLLEKDWLAEESVHDEIRLKCDFRKSGIWLEVEFGNARTYYQDYIKFLIASRFRHYNCGILLCPTSSFGAYLCELGRYNAQMKHEHSAKISYSGMMTYEKATRELPFIEHIVRERIVIAGIDVHDTNLKRNEKKILK